MFRLSQEIWPDRPKASLPYVRKVRLSSCVPAIGSANCLARAIFAAFLRAPWLVRNYEVILRLPARGVALSQRRLEFWDSVEQMQTCLQDSLRQVLELLPGRPSISTSEKCNWKATLLQGLCVPFPQFAHMSRSSRERDTRQGSHFSALDQLSGRMEDVC